MLHISQHAHLGEWETAQEHWHEVRPYAQT
jgi:hypothetical protein